jgi:hypothetical protein
MSELGKTSSISQYRARVRLESPFLSPVWPVNCFRLHTLLPYVHDGSDCEYDLSPLNTCQVHHSPTKFNT